MLLYLSITAYCLPFAAVSLPADWALSHDMGHSNLDIVMTYYHPATTDLLNGMASVDFRLMLSTQAKQSSDVGRSG